MDICAVCAWRETCKKKFSISGKDLRCPDFARDVTIKEKTEEDKEEKNEAEVSGDGAGCQVDLAFKNRVANVRSMTLGIGSDVATGNFGVVADFTIRFDARLANQGSVADDGIVADIGRTFDDRIFKNSHIFADLNLAYDSSALGNLGRRVDAGYEIMRQENLHYIEDTGSVFEGSMNSFYFDHFCAV